MFILLVASLAIDIYSLTSAALDAYEDIAGYINTCLYANDFTPIEYDIQVVRTALTCAIVSSFH